MGLVGVVTIYDLMNLRTRNYHEIMTSCSHYVSGVGRGGKVLGWEGGLFLTCCWLWGVGLGGVARERGNAWN